MIGQAVVEFWVGELRGQGRKERLRFVKEVWFIGQRSVPVCMALDSCGEAEAIVECEKKMATGRSAVTSEWTLAS